MPLSIISIVPRRFVIFFFLLVFCLLTAQHRTSLLLFVNARNFEFPGCVDVSIATLLSSSSSSSSSQKQNQVVTIPHPKVNGGTDDFTAAGLCITDIPEGVTLEIKNIRAFALVFRGGKPIVNARVHVDGVVCEKTQTSTTDYPRLTNDACSCVVFDTDVAIVNSPSVVLSNIKMIFKLAAGNTLSQKEKERGVKVFAGGALNAVLHRAGANISGNTKLYKISNFYFGVEEDAVTGAAMNAGVYVDPGDGTLPTNKRSMKFSAVFFTESIDGVGSLIFENFIFNFPKFSNYPELPDHPDGNGGGNTKLILIRISRNLANIYETLTIRNFFTKSRIEMSSPSSTDFKLWESTRRFDPTWKGTTASHWTTGQTKQKDTEHIFQILVENVHLRSSHRATPLSPEAESRCKFWDDGSRYFAVKNFIVKDVVFDCGAQIAAGRGQASLTFLGFPNQDGGKNTQTPLRGFEMPTKGTMMLMDNFVMKNISIVSEKMFSPDGDVQSVAFSFLLMIDCIARMTFDSVTVRINNATMPSTMAHAKQGTAIRHLFVWFKQFGNNNTIVSFINCSFLLNFFSNVFSADALHKNYPAIETDFSRISLPQANSYGSSANGYPNQKSGPFAYLRSAPRQPTAFVYDGCAFRLTTVYLTRLENTLAPERLTSSVTLARFTTRADSLSKAATGFLTSLRMANCRVSVMLADASEITVCLVDLRPQSSFGFVRPEAATELRGMGFVATDELDAHRPGIELINNKIENSRIAFFSVDSTSTAPEKRVTPVSFQILRIPSVQSVTFFSTSARSNNNNNNANGAAASAFPAKNIIINNNEIRNVTVVAGKKDEVLMSLVPPGFLDAGAPNNPQAKLTPVNVTACISNIFTTLFSQWVKSGSVEDDDRRAEPIALTIFGNKISSVLVENFAASSVAPLVVAPFVDTSVLNIYKKYSSNNDDSIFWAESLNVSSNVVSDILSSSSSSSSSSSATQEIFKLKTVFVSGGMLLFSHPGQFVRIGGTGGVGVFSVFNNTARRIGYEKDISNENQVYISTLAEAPTGVGKGEIVPSDLPSPFFIVTSAIFCYRQNLNFFMSVFTKRKNIFIPTIIDTGSSLLIQSNKLEKCSVGFLRGAGHFPALLPPSISYVVFQNNGLQFDDELIKFDENDKSKNNVQYKTSLLKLDELTNLKSLTVEGNFMTKCRYRFFSSSASSAATTTHFNISLLSVKTTAAVNDQLNLALNYNQLFDNSISSSSSSSKLFTKFRIFDFETSSSSSSSSNSKYLSGQMLLLSNSIQKFDFRSDSQQQQQQKRNHLIVDVALLEISSSSSSSSSASSQQHILISKSTTSHFSENFIFNISKIVFAQLGNSSSRSDNEDDDAAAENENEFEISLFKLGLSSSSSSSSSCSSSSLETSEVLLYNNFVSSVYHLVDSHFSKLDYDTDGDKELQFLFSFLSNSHRLGGGGGGGRRDKSASLLLIATSLCGQSITVRDCAVGDVEGYVLLPPSSPTFDKNTNQTFSTPIEDFIARNISITVAASASGLFLLNKIASTVSASLVLFLRKSDDAAAARVTVQGARLKERSLTFSSSSSTNNNNLLDQLLQIGRRPLLIRRNETKTSSRTNSTTQSRRSAKTEQEEEQENSIRPKLTIVVSGVCMPDRCSLLRFSSSSSSSSSSNLNSYFDIRDNFVFGHAIASLITAYSTSFSSSNFLIRNNFMKIGRILTLIDARTALAPMLAAPSSSSPMRSAEFTVHCNSIPLQIIRHFNRSFNSIAILNLSGVDARCISHSHEITETPSRPSLSASATSTESATRSPSESASVSLPATRSASLTDPSAASGSRSSLSLSESETQWYSPPPPFESYISAVTQTAAVAANLLTTRGASAATASSARFVQKMSVTESFVTCGKANRRKGSPAFEEKHGDELETMLEPLEVADSPTMMRIEISSGAALSTFNGGIIGNIIVTVGFVLICQLLSLILVVTKNARNRKRALLKIKWPSIIWVPLSILGPPTAGAAATIVMAWLHPEGAVSAGEVVLVVLGVVFFFIAPLAWSTYLGRECKATQTLEEVDEQEQMAAVTESDGFTRQIGKLLLMGRQKLFGQWKEWHETRFIRANDILFGSVGAPYFAAIDFGAAGIASILGGVAALCVENECCLTAAFANALVSLTYFVAIIVCKPAVAYLCRFDLALNTVTALMMVIMSVLAVLFLVVGDAKDVAAQGTFRDIFVYAAPIFEVVGWIGAVVPLFDVTTPIIETVCDKIDRCCATGPAAAATTAAGQTNHDENNAINNGNNNNYNNNDDENESDDERGVETNQRQSQQLQEQPRRGGRRRHHRHDDEAGEDDQNDEHEMRLLPPPSEIVTTANNSNNNNKRRSKNDSKSENRKPKIANISQMASFLAAADNGGAGGGDNDDQQHQQQLLSPAEGRGNTRRGGRGGHGGGGEKRNRSAGRQPAAGEGAAASSLLRRK